MQLGVGHVQLQPLQLHASAQRECCSVAALVLAGGDAHFLGSQGVVAGGQVELLAQQQVGTQHQVAPQPVLPVVEAYQRGREAQRRPHEAFRHTQLQVERHALEVVLIGCELSAQVAGHGRDAPYVISVVIVQAQVYGGGQRVVLANVGGDEAGGDASVNAVAQGVGKGAAHGNVLGTEGARLLARQGGLLHLAVVDEAPLDAPCGPFAHKLMVAGSGRERALHIGHHAERQLTVAGCIDQGRIVEHQCAVVVANGDIVAAQCCHVGTDRQPQEVEHGAAVLRPQNENKGRQENGKKDLFHLNNHKYAAKIRLFSNIRAKFAC